MTTSIDDLVEGMGNVSFLDTDASFQILRKTILDFDQSEETRLSSIDILSQTYPSQVQDVLSSIVYIAMSLQLPSTEAFVGRIVRECSIDSICKVVLAEMMETTMFELLEWIFVNENLSLLFSKRVLYKLVESNIEKKAYFFAILSDTTLDLHEQYSYLVDFETTSNKPFLEELALFYLSQPHILNRFKILACQFLLYTDLGNVENITETLLSIARMTDLDTDVRADAVDVLLSSKRILPGGVSSAVRILAELGGRAARTVYDNQQNVHSSEIEASAMGILNALPLTGPSVDSIEKLLSERSLTQNQKEGVELALNRIRVDRRAPHSLSSILSRVVAYILPHEHVDEMLKRLVEELVDGCSVCSSGLAVRLLNVLSGFDDFAIRISFGDQIVANFATLLNNTIMNIPNAYLIEDILTQMAIPTEHFEQRSDFLDFLAQNIGSLRTSLYEEFKDNVSESDFDEYFKKALLTYQGF